MSGGRSMLGRRGCLHPAFRHGHGGSVDGPPSATYSVWVAMTARCHNPNNPNHPRYGGRGIKVCRRWRDSFDNFLADMGERPPGKSLERVDNDGNYEPRNCRWATRREQANNTRRNVRITIDGVTRTVAEWCAITGINQSTANKRINRSGWPPELAVTQPLMRGKKL